MRLACSNLSRVGAVVLAAAGCGTTSHADVLGSSNDAAARDIGHDVSATPDTLAAHEADPVHQSFALSVTSVDTSFDTEDHFIAALEMQLSGEPFAEAMGRNLDGYSRAYACRANVCSPGEYLDSPSAPAGPDGRPLGVVDLAGFSSAVESYEYSKQPMNNVAFESGAGTSLLFGPVIDPAGVTGKGALALAQAWMSHMAGASNALSRFVHATDAANPLGWPGLWPTLQPFSRWDPAIAPTRAAGCAISSDDGPGTKGALTSGKYECDYTSLHLPDRAGQVSPTIGPGASGWVDWKDALWTLNYLQSLHGGKERAVTAVNPVQLANVGIPGNAVTGSLLAGVYLGSSDIEGFQAGNFIQILDNQAAQWLTQLTTSDGATLWGFASIGDALEYGTASLLRWFPASIAVTETPDESGFPAPTRFAIVDPASRLLDLAGLLGAYASAYALTDRSNAEVGGSQPVLAYFDGDPFPVQNQAPSGEPTLHDRALAMIRVLVVNIARLHVDPATGLPADEASMALDHVSRGSLLSSDVAAYTLLAMRTARRALDSELTLYGNTKPDTAGIPSPLDAFPAVDGAPFGARLDQLIASLAEVFYSRLTTPDGHAYAGWDLEHSAPTDAGTSLDAHTAAVRGLLLAYLATGATKYRVRAEAVFEHVESAFYDPAARVYRPVEGDRSTQVTFTPRRFALLQAMLRDTYELVAVLPGNDAMAALVLDRVGRLNKLVLNGWDDRDEDQRIAWPSECARLGMGLDHQPLGLGGLQMAERVLTGEPGSTSDAAGAGPRIAANDRDRDCVPEISAVGLPSALANAITFALTPWTPAQRGKVRRNGGWVVP